MTSWQHEERLNAVHGVVQASGASGVLDLGCGDGDLFVRLVEDPRCQELVGLDICRASLGRLRSRLSERSLGVRRVDLREASMTEPPPDLEGFDCAILIETIEHLDPGHLSKLDGALFRPLGPHMAIITTPNADFDPLPGVPPHRMRHPGHRFAWGAGSSARGAIVRPMRRDRAWRFTISPATIPTSAGPARWRPAAGSMRGHARRRHAVGGKDKRHR